MNTLDSLDWPTLIESLTDGARTPMGRRAARLLDPLKSPEEVERAYNAIDEVSALLEDGWPLPLSDVGEIASIVRRAAKGQTLDGPDIRLVGITHGALQALSEGLMERIDLCPQLALEASAITLDLGLLAELNGAFDPTGQLSARQYPELASLRSDLQALHGSVRSTLEGLLQSHGLQDVLQDHYITQRSERYVLPIQAHAKRWNIGVVHDTSQSGNTVFIEPHEVIVLNNRIRIAEGQLKAAEKRILSRLSHWIGSTLDQSLIALDIATQIDLAVARQRFAQRLNATRPVVGDSGVITLKAARHPVLTLRGLDVVPNTLALSEGQPGLLLSGPNTGGKTVALKTIGLCVLLVQHGCFIPTLEHSRCDFFPVVQAVIGDNQTIQEDLSSFSAHLTQLKMLLKTSQSGHLLLLDEICTGTDPAQGSALGRALIEAFLDLGATLVITTHFSGLKALAATDERLEMAAVEYANGRPTYRVIQGATGESHAFDIAERLGINASILQRAKSWMSQGEHQLSEALSALDDRRIHLSELELRLSQERAELSKRSQTLAQREERVLAKLSDLEATAGRAFLDRLKTAERAISAVVADLQKSPSHHKVTSARAALSALKSLSPKAELAPISEVRLSPRDRVTIASLGQVGEVVRIDGAMASVRVGTLSLKLKSSTLTRLDNAPKRSYVKPKRSIKASKRSKHAPTVRIDQVMKLPSNTLDLRGHRVDEGLDALDTFIDRALLAHHSAIFILHGHGTGAMKRAVRDHLKRSDLIERSAPANVDQGGDAFTIGLLK